MSVRMSFVLSSVLACFLVSPRPTAAGTELVMAAVPGDGVIRLTDYGHKGWGPEVLHYRVDTSRFHPGEPVLLNGEGKAVPFQIKGVPERRARRGSPDPAAGGDRRSRAPLETSGRSSGSVAGAATTVRQSAPNLVCSSRIQSPK
jgi:hypothetical protein